MINRHYEPRPGILSPQDEAGFPYFVLALLVMMKEPSWTRPWLAIATATGPELVEPCVGRRAQ